MLTDEERRRYERHTMLPEIGIAGQERLKSGSVLCVGTGGLGSPAALYLAAAGVGRIGLVDDDTVAASNLQRQILHGESDVSRSKLISARETLREVNSHVQIDLHETRLTAGNARSLVSQYDVVIDGSDNFPTRFAVADACVLEQRPNVYGSIYKFAGQATVFAPHLGGPCYRCMLPDIPAPGAAPT